MTAAIDSTILQKSGKDLGLENAHIRCFCHKIALILSAGLKAINLPSEGLVKEGKTLGFVPALKTIHEESGDSEPNKTPEDSSDKDFPSDGYSDASDSNSDYSNKEASDHNTNKKSKILSILSKVDSVIQRITSSAAKQSEFKVWCDKLDCNGPSLIAGHGIRWNIKWESQSRAYQGRKVIGKLIENEKD
ncbi:hypothetical protein PCASD_06266 [Puccinia coronata f. sp. avenae]|uniref:HAT C-terminal dimerisation domain-containing protein n=1 Tax=Puccinia coronata f. sp. avenae TaxID=200324 RepID=A0A2N5V6G1_9BASI|nr:hypothetical protein PCASD_24758 [Puccinia coronata f. sp. avenae]PLW45577.1 hypothetical protein PCASD_06266 [Puccinia coronata f. sp. avenae]